eukprot:COSAG01_NODE_1467_length_10217_cov_33.824570_6_plen_90_part_00
MEWCERVICCAWSALLCIKVDFFSAGTTLRPEWGQLVGVELYSHAPGNSSTSCDAHVNACFDGTENKNLVKVRCILYRVPIALHYYTRR